VSCLYTMNEYSILYFNCVVTVLLILRAVTYNHHNNNLMHEDEMVFCSVLFVCKYVCTLYKFTFLNRSEPNFAHVSPLVWKRPYSMYGPEILDLFDLLGPFSLGATAESWAQDGCRHDRFLQYPYIRGSSWCSCDITNITLSQTAESSAAALYP